MHTHVQTCTCVCLYKTYTKEDVGTVNTCVYTCPSSVYLLLPNFSEFALHTNPSHPINVCFSSLKIFNRSLILPAICQVAVSCQPQPQPSLSPVPSSPSFHLLSSHFPHLQLFHPLKSTTSSIQPCPPRPHPTHQTSLTPSPPSP